MMQYLVLLHRHVASLDLKLLKLGPENLESQTLHFRSLESNHFRFAYDEMLGLSCIGMLQVWTSSS